MKRISINCAHTILGKGYGAYYNSFSESTIVRAVGYELMNILKRKGHKVFNSTVDIANSQNDYLKKAVKLVNNADVDLAISLHCNSSFLHTGNGIEIYSYNGKEHKEALNILEAFEKKGFNNRGVKDGSKLYFVKHTKPKALLIELFFLDNNIDRTLYNKLGHKELARLLFNAIAS